jgi:hypothetical protein
VQADADAAHAAEEAGEGHG